MESIKLILNLISIGMGLACAGTLAEVVVQLRHDAAQVHREGVVSLGKWNRKLMSPARTASPASKPKNRPTLRLPHR